jgi:hypothetical protein
MHVLISFDSNFHKSSVLSWQNDRSLFILSYSLLFVLEQNENLKYLLQPFRGGLFVFHWLILIFTHTLSLSYSHSVGWH